jgi:hypothetical protein
MVDKTSFRNGKHLKLPFTAQMKHQFSNPSNVNRTGKVYSMENTKIPKVFFMPHHRARYKQDNQGNNKCNN